MNFSLLPAPSSHFLGEHMTIALAKDRDLRPTSLKQADAERAAETSAQTH